jgi:hypothetical protein
MKKPINLDMRIQPIKMLDKIDDLLWKEIEVQIRSILFNGIFHTMQNNMNYNIYKKLEYELKKNNLNKIQKFFMDLTR